MGIIPLLPMIHRAELIGADWQLLYGGRSRASMAFREELSAAQETERTSAARASAACWTWPHGWAPRVPAPRSTAARAAPAAPVGQQFRELLEDRARLVITRGAGSGRRP
jgi:ferredoxin-NADP reductase